LFAALTAMLVVWGGTAAATGGGGFHAPMSGAAEFGDVELGTNITECPQAGIRDRSLRRRERDEVERISDRGNDIRLNQDYECMPQDEMSIAVNPLDSHNVVGGANDYRLGWATSGFYSTSDRYDHTYDGLRKFPTIPGGPDHLDGGGDPAIAFDREGTVYYAAIQFNRDDDTNGIYVSRSTNGGFTWSRPCTPLGSTDASAVCGGNGDPRQPGDGRVTFLQDPDHSPDFDVPFDDKEYIAAGPRPGGVSPVCYLPVSRTPTTCDPALVGPDRVYVTWTRFDLDDTAKIMASHSDDRGRSWSPPGNVVSGNAPFCVFGTANPNDCDQNQFSVPQVHPTNGVVYVAYENFNTPDENQYLVSVSTNGGDTWSTPRFATSVFDANYPRSGGPSATRNRPDCTPRGQSGGRAVLTNSCFRLNSGGTIVVDKRGGAFADDLYLFMSDNRNGTRESSNTDVLLFKSTNGGLIWAGPTRVNDDPSAQPANRNCGRTGEPACPSGVNTGNDQFYPWADISGNGWLNGAWQDRRLDTSSTASEWPTSRSRPGNYLLWYWGANCRITTTGPLDQSSGRQCVAPSAGIITQPTAPVDPGNELFPNQTVFPHDNFGISDTPYNWDYCFRAGIFCGDYEGLTIGPDNKVWAQWTDARNGRSSRMQAGRNPACEQSDVWAERYEAHGHANGQNHARSSDSLYLVTPCPADNE